MDNESINENFLIYKWEDNPKTAEMTVEEFKPFMNQPLGRKE